jgi:hypothetical protein
VFCPLTLPSLPTSRPLPPPASPLSFPHPPQGFYPAGAPDPARSHQPGAALVKAILIAGAAELGGFEEDSGLPLAPPPSYRMGHGRVDLSASLPLAPAAFEGRRLADADANATASNATATTASRPVFALQVVDRAELRTGGADAYCVRSTGGPLSVALAWQDAPGSPAAAKALVNDLDLEVRSSSLGGGLALLGNGGGKGGEPDRVNNVETVHVVR